MTSCPGPRISRRQMIQAGAASLPRPQPAELLRAEESRKTDASADACIVIFLNGGPSHLDMWDMKPDAPAEIRGEFKPIADERARRAVRRTPAAVRPADAPLHADPLGASQRQQRPRGGGLLRAHRPRPRRDRRRRAARRLPGDRLGRRHAAAARRRGRAVRAAAVHHEGRRGRPAAAGLLRRLARQAARPALRPARPERRRLRAAGTDARPGRRPDALRRAQAARPTAWPRPASGRAVRDDMDGIRAKAFDLLDVAGDARGRPDRPRAGEGARRLRPQHLRPERAAGAAADRGRHAGGVRLVGAGRQRDLGHARRQLREAQGRAAAAARRGGLERCSTTSTTAGCWSGRSWW